MHIVSKKTLRDFWEREKFAESPLNSWYKFTKKSRWQNLTEVKVDFSQINLVGKCVIFDIGGNKFRLIVWIDFRKQKIYIKSVLTHKEYDKNVWKSNC